MNPHVINRLFIIIRIATIDSNIHRVMTKKSCCYLFHKGIEASVFGRYSSTSDNGDS